MSTHQQPEKGQKDLGAKQADDTSKNKVQGTSSESSSDESQQESRGSIEMDAKNTHDQLESKRGVVSSESKEGLFEDLAGDLSLRKKNLRKCKDDDQIDDRDKNQFNIKDNFRNGAVFKSFVGGGLEMGKQALQSVKQTVKKEEDIFHLEEVSKKQRRSLDVTDSITREEVKEYNSSNESDGINDIINMDKNGKQDSDSAADDDDSSVSEGEKQRILANLSSDGEDDEGEEDEEDDNDDGDGEDEEDKEGSDDKSSEGTLSNLNEDDQSSLLMDDIADRSLVSDPPLTIATDADTSNYFKYVSDKHQIQTDLLEVVDKNERSFKQVAETMIQMSSQLITPVQNENIQGGEVAGGKNQDQTPARRLMHFKVLQQVANLFHGDVKLPLGFPYSIAAIEEYIAIGSSDGAIRIYDSSYENEIKVLAEKSLKGSAVLSLDIKRHKNNSIFVIAGYAKGQIALFEVKGINKNSEDGNITSKHQKTISDIHHSSVISVKFFGEVGPEAQTISTVSCDLDGVVYICFFSDGILGFNVNKLCFTKKRLGPTFSISALLTNTAEDEIQNNIYEDLFNRDEEQNMKQSGGKNQLIAFGSLERILIAQIKPKAQELRAIERPEYIDQGTVPYLDWGYGLSPSFRDKAYAILAIAWGKSIQLAVYTNSTCASETEKPDLQYDGFYICEGFSIDSCFFLSESILFVIINKQEVRILYTQNFTPGIFDENIVNSEQMRPVDTIERKRAFMNIKEKFVGQVSTYAEKDKGYRLMESEIRHKDIITSKSGRSKFNFNPTVCKNEDNIVVALGKTNIGQGKLLHWEEYLDIIRKTNPNDWLKVLRTSLDIFNGKMVGLAGLPDQKDAREQLLRNRMKDLLRENIDACIREFQEGECVQNKTLRLALEFCIRVGAIDHLFGELFTMFAEAGMEQKYFENLEAFILSGKLKHIKIPDQILNRIIGFYRQKDVELLEKSILNLELKKHTTILEVKEICEKEFLTSALIHLHTNIPDQDNDNTLCLHLLCALFNLMQRSKSVKEKQDVFKLLNKNKQIYYTQQEESNEKQEKQKDSGSHSPLERWEILEIQHSQTYIGYKLMWVMKLFLEGKKFPSGTLSAFTWRMYVFDIVRFTTNERFLKWFLDFDPDAFFKLMRSLYLDQEPFEYLVSQKAFVEMYKDKIFGLDECMSHDLITETLHFQVQIYLSQDKESNNGLLSSKGEALQNAFIFFISQICRKQSINIPEDLCIFVIREQLIFHQKIKLMPNIQSLIPKNQVPQGVKDNDLNQYIYLALVKRNERDVLNLLHRCEAELQEADITRLLEVAESSPMFKVTVYLNKMLGNYQKCLTMYFQKQAIKEEVFSWLSEVDANIHKRNDDITLNQMRDLLLKNIKQFVEMDPSQTNKLAMRWFDGDHLKIVKSLKNSKEHSFQYIGTLLNEKEPLIVEAYNQGMMTGAQSYSYVEYKELILIFVRILCDKKYKSKIVDYVSKNYYPIEECLRICQEKGIKDACAVLYKRQGEYTKSITLYIEVLQDLSVKEIISELYVNAQIKFNDPSIRSEHIKRFDTILSNIIHICHKYGSRLEESETEELWLFSINSLYGITSVVFGKMTSLNEEDKSNFSTFLLIRIQVFMKRMSEHVGLAKIMQFLEDIGKPIKYQEFKQTFEDKVKTESYHENILISAKELLMKDLIAATTMLTNIYSVGCKNTSDKCDYCKRQLNSKWDIQSVWVFRCGHIYHQRCAEAPNNQCFLCYNEYEQIQLIISQRGIRRSKKPNQDDAVKGRSLDFQGDSDENYRSQTMMSRPNQVYTLASEQSQYEQFQKTMSSFDLEQNLKLLKLENFQK